MVETIVFDLDGTLFHLPPDCLTNGEFCKDTFRANQHLAEPINPMINLFDLYSSGPYKYNLVILTARPDFMRAQTESHLETYNIFPDLLIMREEHCPLTVSEYKVNHLKELAEKGHSITMVFDDKQEIVDAANAAGFYAVKVP